MKLIRYDELKYSYIFFNQKPCRAIYGFIITIIIIISAFIVWSLVFELDDIVTGDVILRPVLNVSTVRTEYTGGVVYIGYEDNGLVKKDETLLILDTSILKKEQEKIETRLASNRIEQKILNTLIQVIKAEDLSMVSEEDRVYSRCVSYISELDRLKKVVENSESQYRREENKSTMVKVGSTIEDLKNVYEQSKLNLKAFKNDSDYQAKSALLNLKTEEEVLVRDMENVLKEISKSEIKAPLSGKVLSLKKLNIGDTVFSTEEILQIIPNDTEELKAEIIVRAEDIARVSVGNEIRIKLNGLSVARYGYSEAKVISISPDYKMVSDGSLGFTVYGQIKDTELKTRRGEKLSLKVGLIGTAKIVVGHEKAYMMLLRKLDFVI